MKPKPQKRKITNAANLEPYRIADAEQAREMGHRGGVASGIARREKRTLRAWAELLRDEPAPDGAEGETNAGAAIVAAYREAQSGNVQAVRFLSELMGEMDAPDTFNGAIPPPIIIGIHDPAFVEAERRKLEAQGAELDRLADGGDGEPRPDAAGATETGAEARGKRGASKTAPGGPKRVKTPSRSPGGVAYAPDEIPPDLLAEDEPQKPKTRREAVALMEAKRGTAAARKRGTSAAPSFLPSGFSRRR